MGEVDQPVQKGSCYHALFCGGDKNGNVIKKRVLYAASAVGDLMTDNASCHILKSHCIAGLIAAGTPNS